MSKIILEVPKGTRDILPKEKISRDNCISKIKKIFEVYGFSPIETPTFEKLEILENKSGAGENSDAVSEIYRFKDQGNRELGLRYEFTFALARIVGQNPQLKMPFRRYQIGPVYRDGPIKAGRYREFYQCDVDIVGVSSVIADAELLSLAKDVFKSLNLDIIIEVNSRKLLTDILNYSNIDKDQATQVIISIDKLKKIGINEVKKELLGKEISKEAIEKLMFLLTDLEKGSNTDKINYLEKRIGNTDGLQEIKELFKYLSLFKVEFIFSPTLARGLGYYTGPIFEIFLKDPSIISGSIAGGGRWDNLIGKYIGNENLKQPATGISFGIEPIMDIILKKENITRQSVCDLFLIPINTLEKSIEIAQYLRDKGIKTIVDLQSKSISKNLEYASKLGIPFVGFIGEDELKQNMIKIRDMILGKEELTDIDKVKL